MQTMTQILSEELGLNPAHVENVIALLDEGNTVPFIARYRKEQHGTMDDQTIRELADRLEYLRGLQARREEVKRAIEAQEKLTEELSLAIDQAATLAEVEDLYRPYKQKRRTRASVAREKGLGPLADLLMSLDAPAVEAAELAADYINAENGIETAEDALAGACDIIAEQISDDAALRKTLRALVQRTGILQTAAASEEDSVYRTYYDFKQPASRLQSHQVLAINRGEKESFLKVTLICDEDAAQVAILRAVLHPKNRFAAYIRETAKDAWSRLIFPSITREVRSDLTDRANEQSIHTFALNLRPLLMQPPVRGKVTLGFDPAYRTGCKLAVVDETGRVLETGVVYPVQPHNKTEEAKRTLRRMCDQYKISCIAIGNGTASRESEIFVADFLKEYGGNISYMVVSEAGASVYSASKLGAEEFPEFDVSLRSAVSIARRLQDPLAELVKIDPKAIGVGQYQHDMPQSRLSDALDGVVEDCVNAVGVDLNTASPSLLQRVAGISGTVAKNIFSYREGNGTFQTRKQLLKVPKLGPKAFEQCAGFLRVLDGGNLLDRTAVHPESYAAAEKLLELCGYTVSDIGKLDGLRGKAEEIGLQKAAEVCGVGVPTLQDIINELQKPGRDPRDELPPPMLRSDVLDIKDLAPGMKLDGTVRNVVDFGVFVDIGVHQDGLVHISQITNRFIKHPSEALSVGDIVKVVVLEVDAKKKRIALSIKQA